MRLTGWSNRTSARAFFVPSAALVIEGVELLLRIKAQSRPTRNKSLFMTSPLRCLHQGLSPQGYQSVYAATDVPTVVLEARLIASELTLVVSPSNDGTTSDVLPTDAEKPAKFGPILASRIITEILKKRKTAHSRPGMSVAQYHHERTNEGFSGSRSLCWKY